MLRKHHTGGTRYSRYRFGARIVGCAALLSSGAAHAQNQPVGLIFHSERIEIAVRGHHCTVTGEYNLLNHAAYPFRGTIFYPFVVEPDLPYPDTVTVLRGDGGIEVPFMHANDGIRFPLQVDPYDTLVLKVSYSQRSPNNRMKYILTTTRQWGRPLAAAEFVVRIPRHLELVGVSLHPDSVGCEGEYTKISIKRKRFMPDEDLEILWKEK